MIFTFFKYLQLSVKKSSWFLDETLCKKCFIHIQVFLFLLMKAEKGASFAGDLIGSMFR